MSYNYQYLKVEVKKDILNLTLNRPKHRNALDEKMLEEIEDVISDAETNKDIKIIIFKSSEAKVFAAGADVKQLNQREPLEVLMPGMQGLYDKIENCPKITIAVVQGFALGGGCELTLACDIRIATRNARFGLPELNLGVIPGAGGSQRLSRIVGKSRALDMILTGKIIDGEEAERIGLVSYIAEDEDLDNKVRDITSRIIRKGPIALRLAKQAIQKGYETDQNTALWIEKLSQAVVFGTEDKNEGTKAFLEKRKAIFRNR